MITKQRNCEITNNSTKRINRIYYELFTIKFIKYKSKFRHNILVNEGFVWIFINKVKIEINNYYFHQVLMKISTQEN